MAIAVPALSSSMTVPVSLRICGAMAGCALSTAAESIAGAGVAEACDGSAADKPEFRTAAQMHAPQMKAGFLFFSM